MVRAERSWLLLVESDEVLNEAYEDVRPVATVVVK